MSHTLGHIYCPNVIVPIRNVPGFTYQAYSVAGKSCRGDENARVWPVELQIRSSISAPASLSVMLSLPVKDKTCSLYISASSVVNRSEDVISLIVELEESALTHNVRNERRGKDYLRAVILATVAPDLFDCLRDCALYCAWRVSHTCENKIFCVATENFASPANL